MMALEEFDEIATRVGGEYHDELEADIAISPSRYGLGSHKSLGKIALVRDECSRGFRDGGIEGLESRAKSVMGNPENRQFDKIVIREYYQRLQNALREKGVEIADLTAGMQL